MLIGLLQCDHTAVKYRDLADDIHNRFIALFKEHAPTLATKVFDLTQDCWPNSIEHCDGYLITGSRRSVHDDLPWIARLIQFTQDLHARRWPVVGICFGHQIIAHALGGRVAKSDAGWGIGSKVTHVTERRDWMTPFMAHYRLVVSHQDQVLALPTGAIPLASNDHCPHSMIQIGNHCLGIQGHPDISRAFSHALVQAGKRKYGHEQAAAAIDSLQHNTDEGVIVNWIARFFEGTSNAE